MTARIPSWLGHTDDDVHKLLSACYLWWAGDIDAGVALLYPLFGRKTPHDRLNDMVELIARYQLCWDDPAHYAWVEEGMERPGAGRTWDEYAARMCEAILADLVVQAETLVHRAHVVVAS